ncbi:MAG: insulinase family protein, partial [Kordiimonadaceae bacterium]|nr:insulinase family protein [Kordiimonadaceae bacterium]
MKTTKFMIGAALLAMLTACDGQVGTKSDSTDKAAISTVSEPGIDLEVHIPYEKFTLDNGLRVIVHTDRKAPIVSFGVWYHVGSKDEPAGKTGFAHLFEH